MSKALQYAAGAAGVIVGAAVAGMGSGIGHAYGNHLFQSGRLPLPGAPRGRRGPRGRRSAEESLQRHLKMAACFRQTGLPMPKGFKYNSIDDFVLDRGKFYRKSAPLTESEWAVLNRALGSRECREKECYYNAQMLAAFDPSKKLKYVEGYAVQATLQGFPFHHGWVTINGKVIDLTWRANASESPTHPGRLLTNRVVGVIPPGWAYFGVQFPTSKIHDLLITGQQGTNIIGDWRGGHKEFKWKRKGALDCSDFPTLPKPGGRALRATWKKAPGKQNPRVLKHFKKYIISFDHPTKSDYVWTSRGQLKPGYKIPKLMEFSSESQAAAVIQREVLDYIVDWKQESFEAAINGWAQVGKRPRRRGRQ
jgi:hypothetical protein